MFTFLASSVAAHLHSGELVAVKVQRPGMPLSLTLDALLFHMIGGQLKRFAKARKDLLVAVNEMVSSFSTKNKDFQSILTRGLTCICPRSRCLVLSVRGCVEIPR